VSYVRILLTRLVEVDTDAVSCDVKCSEAGFKGQASPKGSAPTSSHIGS